MNTQVIIKENWLTRSPKELAYISTLVFGILLGCTSYAYLADFWNLALVMPANGHRILKEHEYWRLWTALFAHADTAHLLGNLSLLLPLAFMLTGHFGFYVVPVLGVLVGGLINYIVIQTLPPEVNLIGISGVVYWMGATWLTLFLIIDRRKTLRRRMALAAFLTVVLFIPETYKPEVSYLSHFIGYALGAVTGLLIYILNRNEIESAEVKEIVFEPEDSLDSSQPVTESSLDAARPPKSVN